MNRYLKIPSYGFVIAATLAIVTTAAIADLKGKSIKATTVTSFVLCNPSGRCKRTPNVRTNWKLYVSKDGKRVFDYASKSGGDVIPLNGGKTKSSNGAVISGSYAGSKITLRTRYIEVDDLKIFHLVKNNKCRVSGQVKWHQPGWYGKNTRLRSISCKILKGNAFAR